MKIVMTKKRTSILSVLKNASGALSAKDIHAQLPEIDLTTVYRTLDIFVREGIVQKVHLDTDEALYEHQTAPHHHAVCSRCEKILHFTAPDKKIVQLLGLTGFDIESMEVTVRGKCKNKKMKTGQDAQAKVQELRN